MLIITSYTDIPTFKFKESQNCENGRLSNRWIRCYITRGAVQECGTEERVSRLPTQSNRERRSKNGSDRSQSEPAMHSPGTPRACPHTTEMALIRSDV